MATLNADMPVADFVDQMNETYSDLHKKFEDNFWATKMNHAGNSVDELNKTKNEYNNFLSDQKIFDLVKHHLKNPSLTPSQQKCLSIMEKTYKCYLQQTPEAEEIRQGVVSLESKLEESRNGMKLGYTCPKTGDFKAASSVHLRNVMRTNSDEATRKACYEGLKSIPDFMAEPFCEIIKERNRMAKANGYRTYYEYKLQTTEDMDTKRLFEILDDLETKTRPILDKALKTLSQDKGEDALRPWNMGYMLAGDITQKMDPFFEFERAVPAWACSFAAMNISYHKSEMNLDLCEREKKYSNGFCHWPVAPYIKPDGTSVPCVTNFTSLALPGAPGSGQTALKTLMHEGGHAAHFANVAQPSPFHSQERAPMSVAYAETQSMFLDSLCGDSDWVAKYAVSKKGESVPWDLIEQNIKQTHAYRVLHIRSLMAVPYFENALYELPADEVTADNIKRIADEVEQKILGGPSTRPLLSVPHLYCDELSCLYHGYVLAEMAVHQTRSHFLNKYGFLTDNENIGPELREAYWKSGNSVPFLKLVEDFTGGPLSADSLVGTLNENEADAIKKQKALYEKGVKEGPKYTLKDDIMTILDMKIRLVHGDLVVADTSKASFSECCNQYENWIAKEFTPK